MGEQVAARLNGGVAQLGEHLPCKQGVMSSNLTISIRFLRKPAKLVGTDRHSVKEILFCRVKVGTLKTIYRK